MGWRSLCMVICGVWAFSVVTACTPEPTQDAKEAQLAPPREDRAAARQAEGERELAAVEEEMVAARVSGPLSPEETAAHDRAWFKLIDRWEAAKRKADPNWHGTWAEEAHLRADNEAQTYAQAERSVRAANASVDLRIARGREIMARAGVPDE